MTETVAILTRNRPEAFRCCVNSLRANVELYGHSVRLVVSDDSTPDVVTQNQQTLISSGLPFVHCDRKFKEQYARLVGPTSITNFALVPDDPVAMGAARNFLTLFLAGQKFVMLDDDMECKFAPVPEANDKLRYSLGWNVDVQRVWLWHGGQLQDVDFLKAHHDLLKQRAVVLTIGGSVGDSGMSNTCYVLMNRETLRNVDSPAALDYLVRTRQLLAAPIHPTVVRLADCTGMNIGLDATAALPPFLPIQRGEDTLFGLVLAYCTNRLAAHCNYAMHHTPKRVASLEADLETIASPMLSTWLMQALFWSVPRSCEAFGEKLKEIAKAPNFADYAEHFTRHRTERLLRHLDGLTGLPDFISRETDRLRTALNTAPKFTAPIGMTVEEFRLRLAQYGQMLCAWQDIFETAKAINSKRLGASNV